MANQLDPAKRTMEEPGGAFGARRRGVTTPNQATEPEGTLHVVPHGDAWGIRLGSGGVDRLFRTREEAFRNARSWATLEDRFVVVHGEENPLEVDPPA